MNTRNCPNCGAAVEIYASKCPYCGTSYFDFSNIDVNDTKPIFLRLKQGDGVLVIPVIMSSLSIESSFREDISVTMEFVGFRQF